MPNRSGSGPSTAARIPTALSLTSSSTTTTVACGRSHHDRPFDRPGRTGAAPFSVPRTLTVPAGWTAEVWARVPDARMEAWSPEGDLLVSEPERGKGRRARPRRQRSDAPTERTVLSGLTQPQGLAFARLDGHWVLYVGESDQIDRYPWNGSAVGARTVIAGDLPDLDPAGDDVHRQKDVAVAPDGTSTSTSAAPPTPIPTTGP